MFVANSVWRDVGTIDVGLAMWVWLTAMIGQLVMTSGHTHYGTNTLSQLVIHLSARTGMNTQLIYVWQAHRLPERAGMNTQLVYVWQAHRLPEWAGMNTQLVYVWQAHRLPEWAGMNTQLVYIWQAHRLPERAWTHSLFMCDRLIDCQNRHEHTACLCVTGS